MNSICVIILVTMIVLETYAAICPCENWKPEYEQIDLNCHTKRWNISIKTYNADVSNLCVKSAKTDENCGKFRTFDHIPFDDPFVRVRLECYGFGETSLCESLTYKKKLFGEAYQKNCSTITPPSLETPVINATSSVLVISLGIGGTTLFVAIIAGFLIYRLKKRKTLSSTTMTHMTQSSKDSIKITSHCGSFWTIPPTDYETTDELLQVRSDPEPNITSERLLLGETSSMSETHSFKSQIYSASSVHIGKSLAGSVTSVNSGKSKACSVSSIKSGKSSTGSVSSVNSGKSRTGSVSPVNSGKVQTGSVSSVNSGNLQAGSVSSAHRNISQNFPVSTAHRTMSQRSSVSSAHSNRSQTYSLSPSNIHEFLLQRSAPSVDPEVYRLLSLSDIEQLRIETPRHIITGPTPMPRPGPLVPLPKFS